MQDEQTASATPHGQETVAIEEQFLSRRMMPRFWEDSKLLPTEANSSLLFSSCSSLRSVEFGSERIPRGLLRGK